MAAGGLWQSYCISHVNGMLPGTKYYRYVQELLKNRHQGPVEKQAHLFYQYFWPVCRDGRYYTDRIMDMGRIVV